LERKTTEPSRSLSAITELLVLSMSTKWSADTGRLFVTVYKTMSFCVISQKRLDLVSKNSVPMINVRHP